MIQLAHRVVLTELCNKNCSHCFNAKFRKTGVMDADKLIEFWRLNSSFLSRKRVKLMGGEPTLHPRIYEIMHEGCLYFGGVDVFTNGTTMEKITQDPLNLRYHLSGKIHYIINGFTFDLDTFKEYAPFVSQISLHFVIPYDKTAMYEIVGKIRKCMELDNRFHFIISPDTQVDIFDDEIQERYREVWLEAIKTIIPALMSRGFGFNYDHILPMCFYNQEMLDFLHSVPVHDNNAMVDGIHSMKITCCGDVQMGLIFPNFDIYFCNQTRMYVGNLLNENGTPKGMPEILEMLQPFSKKKTDNVKNLSEKCNGCPVVASCKTGCYYTTLVKHVNPTRFDEE